MNNRKYDERHEILNTEDDDGEAALHEGGGPHLHTHGVGGPGQVDRFYSLKHEDGGGNDEGDEPDSNIDQTDLSAGELVGESIADLGDGEPSINSNSSDGPGGDQDIGALHGGHQLAGNETKIPLSTIQTLNKSGGHTDEAGGDTRDSKIKNVNIFWSALHFLPCNKTQT